MVVDCVGETDPEREPEDEPVLLIELLGAAELELNGDCVGEPLVERETAGDTLCVGDAETVVDCVDATDPEREPEDEPVLLIELLGAAELELNGDCVGEPLVERETAGETLCVGDAVAVVDCVGEVVTLREPLGLAVEDGVFDGKGMQADWPTAPYVVQPSAQDAQLAVPNPAAYVFAGQAVQFELRAELL